MERIELCPLCFGRGWETREQPKYVVSTHAWEKDQKCRMCKGTGRLPQHA